MDFFLKLVRDNALDSLNVVPYSGQVFMYDPAQQADQAIINKNILSGIKYSTEQGSNGTALYTVSQPLPRLVNPVGTTFQIPGQATRPVIPPSTPSDMAIVATQYTSGSDGVTSFFPLDRDGNSMAGKNITLIQLETEIKPLRSTEWGWDPVAGKATLLGGQKLDSGQTCFIIYQIPL